MRHQLECLREQIVQLHGNYTKILPLTMQMVSVAKNSFGVQSIEHAVALNDLGGVYRHLGQYFEAQNVFQKALDILESIVGINNPNYATTLNNMAGLLRLMKQYEQSEKLFLAVIDIYQSTLGEEHFLTLSALNNLGLLYQDMQKYHEAKQLHEKCLKLLEHQTEHPIAYSTTLNNLANLYEKLDDLDQASVLMESVVARYKQNLGIEHPLYANALNNHAALCFKKGDLFQARSLFKQAKDINQKMFGVDSEVYKVSLNNLSIIDQRLNQSQASTPASNQNDSSNSLTHGYGMQLCQNYFEKLCFPVLSQAFPEQINKMAIGLVGEGSECYGFDDELSQDHDFGPRVMVWLTQEDYNQFGQKLQHILNCLPKSFDHANEIRASSWGSTQKQVFSIEEFYAKFTGLYHLPESIAEWEAIPEHHLSVATNGKVFFDPLGQFTHYRNSLLSFYPEDVRLKKMAARCMKIAQAGQYNFARSLKREEYVAASFAGAEFMDAGISMIFLLNRRYQPFYKWMHRALKDLPILGSFSYQLFHDFVHVPLEKRVELIEQFSAKVIEQLIQNRLTDSSSDFLLEHGSSIMQRIQDHQLKNANPWVDKAIQ
ncbi:tetratricopeptide repeat protein [Neisseria sp. Ec49-e6-T10]|uniref:tetratricopeptide repeat protein n=1 Tax=Neisseria sp. Ec49-e6-T10 TaxID=3140744 RepID=UPI003EBF0FFA